MGRTIAEIAFYRGVRGEKYTQSSRSWIDKLFALHVRLKIFGDFLGGLCVYSSADSALKSNLGSVYIFNSWYDFKSPFYAEQSLTCSAYYLSLDVANFYNR